MRRISIKALRRIIREEIGRNYHTIDNDPYSWKDHEGIEVELYPTQDGYFAKVTVDFNDNLSTDLRKFSNEEEATMFARKNVEIAVRHKMSKEL